MEKENIQKKALDARHILLDKNCEDSGNPFCFRNMDEVLASGLLYGGTQKEPVTLYIAPGVYWQHDLERDEPINFFNENGMPCEKTVRFDWLRIVGLSDDPGQVVLASRKGQAFGCIGNYTMFSFEGTGLRVQNLTFGNYCNVDLEYPRDPVLSCPKRTATVTQAQLASFHGEELVAENCRFISRLNLLPISGGDQSLYRNCHFESTDDSLNGHAVYEECDFDFYGSCPFGSTESQGVIFRKCLFRIHAEKLQMVKHNGQLALIDCRFVSDKTLPEPPFQLSNPEVRIYETNNTWNGHSFSMRQFGLQAFLLENALLQDFLCWKEDRPVSLKIMTATANLIYESRWLEIHAAAVSFSGKEILTEIVSFEAFTDAEQPSGKQLKKGGQSKAFELQIVDNQHCRILNCNESPRAVNLIVRAHTAAGLKDEILLTLLPKQLEAPYFETYPTIRQEKLGLKLEYRLNIPAEEDDSLIIWYRLPENGTVSDSSKANALQHNFEEGEKIVVARGRGPAAAIYVPDMDDAGHLLSAEISPAHSYGKTGAACAAGAYKITAANIAHPQTKETDFRFLPLEHRKGKGLFLFHEYMPVPEEMTPEWRKWGTELHEYPWSYGKLGGGCVGSGLYPMQQGSCIMYEPSVTAGQDMRVKIMVDPAKTAGQGFGSPGQYMDVVLRFDPDTHSGAAVRIKRTTRASDGVEFSLIKYEKGVTACLVPPVMISCFLTGCCILTEVHGVSFRAEISCSTPQNDAQRLKGWLHKASLSAALASVTDKAGFCLIHTGTCGDKGWFNTIMLHQIRIEYI